MIYLIDNGEEHSDYAIIGIIESETRLDGERLAHLKKYLQENLKVEENSWYIGDSQWLSLLEGYEGISLVTFGCLTLDGRLEQDENLNVIANVKVESFHGAS